MPANSMTIRRTAAAALVLVLGLSACATASQPYLDSARAGCSAGDQNACSRIAYLESTVNAEQARQTQQVMAGIAVGLGAAAAGAAAGYAASHPVYVQQPVLVVCRWGCY